MLIYSKALIYVTALAIYRGINSITTINFVFLFREVGGFILVMDSLFLFVGLTSSRVTQKPKYFILVCPNKDL